MHFDHAYKKLPLIVSGLGEGRIFPDGQQMRVLVRGTATAPMFAGGGALAAQAECVSACSSRRARPASVRPRVCSRSRVKSWGAASRRVSLSSTRLTSGAPPPPPSSVDCTAASSQRGRTRAEAAPPWLSDGVRLISGTCLTIVPIGPPQTQPAVVPALTTPLPSCSGIDVVRNKIKMFAQQKVPLPPPLSQ